MILLLFFAFIFFLIFVVIRFLGPLPGKIAAKRNHPDAEIIRICGKIGVFTEGGSLWYIALIWAFRTRPLSKKSEAKVNALKQKLRITE